MIYCIVLHAVPVATIPPFLFLHTSVRNKGREGERKENKTLALFYGIVALWKDKKYLHVKNQRCIEMYITVLIHLQWQDIQQIKYKLAYLFL
jgi:hypothetical protein